MLSSFLSQGNQLRIC